MADIQFLPSLGMTGVFTLKTPFNNLVLPNTQYTCTAIESLAGAVAADKDPFATYYEPNGVTEVDFNADLKANVYLITITSGIGEVVVFPSSALVSLPNSDGVIYRNLVLSISLSSISDDTDISVLRSGIEDMILNTMGVKSSTYVTQVGSMTVLTREQSQALEAARQLNIQTRTSPLYDNMQKDLQIASLTQKVGELEAYIARHVSGITI